MKEYPIDGTLDRHVSGPSNVNEFVPKCTRACRDRGILEVRIIRGEGTGALRRQVRGILDENGRVVHHHEATDASGGRHHRASVAARG
ncbi:MAG: DNA mismatch repair protein MutS [Bacteroidetes bacterium QS_1_63_11]|nr:MAG: DNA mismatch repair protein MutS [Bacteroidetes bacterium QS_1_63_11]